MRKLSLEEWKDAAEKINSAEKAVSAIGFNFPKSISNKIVTVLHKLEKSNSICNLDVRKSNILKCLWMNWMIFGRKFDWFEQALLQ